MVCAENCDIAHLKEHDICRRVMYTSDHGASLATSSIPNGIIPQEACRVRIRIRIFKMLLSMVSEVDSNLFDARHAQS